MEVFDEDISKTMGNIDEDYHVRFVRDSHGWIIGIYCYNYNEKEGTFWMISELIITCFNAVLMVVSG